MVTVTHGFEPIRRDLDNRGLIAAYRAAGLGVGRVLVREQLGGGIISGSGITAARIVPGRDDRGTEPARSVLSRLGRMRRPRTLEEASTMRLVRELCRQALVVLGPEAGILHGTSCEALAA
jgi:hypothetical protein